MSALFFLLHIWAAISGVISISYSVDDYLLTDFSVLRSCFAARNLELNESRYCTHVEHDTSQDNVARARATQLLAISKNANNNQCQKAIKYFVCQDIFPYCPKSGKSVNSLSYLPTCSINCEIAKQMCDIDDNNFCDSYRSKTCSLYIQDGYFLLNTEKGPYDQLPILYTIFIAFWGCVSLSFIISLFIFPRQKLSSTPAIIYALSIVFLMRLLSCILSYLFWIECIHQDGICSKRAGYFNLAIIQIAESIQIAILLILAKGSTITRVHNDCMVVLSSLMIVIIFLMLSVIFRGFIFEAPSITFIVYVCILYIYVYVNLLSNTFHEVQLLRAQVSRFTTNMNPEIISAFTDKLQMFQGLYLILVICVILEAILQYLHARDNFPTLIVLSLHETITILLFGYLGYLFRPRRFTPFYFMMPVRNNQLLFNNEHNNHANLNRSNREIPMATVYGTKFIVRKKLIEENPNNESKDDTTHENTTIEFETEIEMAPLLNEGNGSERYRNLFNLRNNSNHSQSGQLVVVNRVDGGIDLGNSQNVYETISSTTFRSNTNTRSGNHHHRSNSSTTIQQRTNGQRRPRRHSSTNSTNSNNNNHNSNQETQTQSRSITNSQTITNEDSSNGRQLAVEMRELNV